MGTTKQVAPLAREEGLVIQEMSGEVLVYDLKRHKAHCLNQTAAFIWKSCDGKATIAEIATRLQKELSAPCDEQIVWLGLAQLSKTHLLREPVAKASAARAFNAGQVTRREVIRKAGLAAAVGIPLVTSILAPKAMAQASCLPRDAACTLNSQCCSGNCRGNGLCS